MKTVGIIGAGRIGQAMARIAQRAGRSVVISNRKGPESLASLVAELGDGVSAGTVAEAVAQDVVVLAVMWPDVPGAVEGHDFAGRILIDPTNDFEPSDLDGRTSSEVVAELVASARVVKTANILGAEILAADPHEAGGRRVMFMSGDDADAKSEVGAILDGSGYFVIDLGGLADGGRMQQVGGPLAGNNLIHLG
jgi:8-hydroxy-5-deazaflavin:NADPH oxidoreductase